MIKANDIHKSFGNLNVLKGINLEIKKGEIVSIVGASGAGKSTLLHIIGTLDRADEGSVEIEGRIIQIAPTLVVLDTADGQVSIPAKEFNETATTLLKKD